MSNNESVKGGQVSKVEGMYSIDHNIRLSEVKAFSDILRFAIMLILIEQLSIIDLCHRKY